MRIGSLGRQLDRIYILPPSTPPPVSWEGHYIIGNDILLADADRLDWTLAGSLPPMSIKTDLTICIQLEWNVREKQRGVRATREDGAIDGLGVTDETYIAGTFQQK